MCGPARISGGSNLFASERAVVHERDVQGKGHPVSIYRCHLRVESLRMPVRPTRGGIEMDGWGWLENTLAEISVHA